MARRSTLGGTDICQGIHEHRAGNSVSGRPERTGRSTVRMTGCRGVMVTARGVAVSSPHRRGPYPPSIAE